MASRMLLLATAAALAARAGAGRDPLHFLRTRSAPPPHAPLTPRQQAAPPPPRVAEPEDACQLRTIAAAELTRHALRKPSVAVVCCTRWQLHANEP